jgi:hypothetical protein
MDAVFVPKASGLSQFSQHVVMRGGAAISGVQALREMDQFRQIGG